MTREDRYLAHTTPSSFARLQQQVPEQLDGSTVLAWGWQHWDSATTVSAGVSLAPACVWLASRMQSGAESLALRRCRIQSGLPHSMQCMSTTGCSSSGLCCKAARKIRRRTCRCLGSSCSRYENCAPVVLIYSMQAQSMVLHDFTTT